MSNTLQRASICAVASCLCLVATFGSQARAELPSLVNDIPIGADKPISLFSSQIFYPGETITVQVEGAATPYRRFENIEECTLRIFVCISHQWVRRQTADVTIGVDRLPLLATVSDTQGRGVTPQAVDPPLAPSPFARTQTPFWTVHASRSVLRINASDVGRAAELMTGLQFAAYIADKYDNQVPYARQDCIGDQLDVCSAGKMTVRLVSVNVEARMNAVIKLLQSAQIPPGSLDKLIDNWLLNDVSAGGLVPAAMRAQQLSDALVAQAKLQPSDPTLRGGDRRAFLELAVKLNPENQAAHAELVTYLVSRGDFLEAKKELQASLPGLKDAYDHEQGSDPSQPVHAAPYLQYAQALVAASDVALGQRGAVIGSNVKAGVELLDEANNVFSNLRTRPAARVIWDKDRSITKTLAREAYLASLVAYASASQLLRGQSDLARAVQKLKTAQSLFPHYEAMLPVALDSDGKRMLATAAPLRQQLLAGDLHAAVEVRLLPLDMIYAIGGAGSTMIGVDSKGYVLRWEEGPFADSLTKLGIDVANDEIASATVAGSRTLIRIQSTGHVDRFTLVSDATTTNLSGAIAALYTGSDTLITFDGSKVGIIPNGGSSSTIVLGTQGVSWRNAEMAATPDGGRVALLANSGANDPPASLIVFDPQHPATMSTIALGAPILADGSLHLTLTDSGRPIIITPTHICVIDLPNPSSAQSPMPRCVEHGIVQVGSRLLAPGVIPLGGEVVAFGLRPVGENSAAVEFVDASKLLIALRADMNAGSAKTEAIYELRLETKTDWNKALIAPAFVQGNSEIRLRLLVPEIQSQLIVMGLENLTLENLTFTEPHFSGQAVLLDGGRQVRIVDRTARVVREPLRPAGHSDPALGDIIDGRGDAGWFSIVRDGLGIKGLDRHAPGTTTTTPIPLDSNPTRRFRLVLNPGRDHGIGQMRYVFVATGAPAASVHPIEARVLSSSTGTVTRLQVFGRDPDNLIAVLPISASGLTIERAPDGVYGWLPDGSAMTTNPLLDAKFTAAGASIETFMGDDLLVLRAFTKDYEGRIIQLRNLPDGPQVSTTPFSAAGLARLTDGGDARRFGIGESRVGYVDAELGLFLIPGEQCLRVSTVKPEALPHGQNLDLWRGLPPTVPATTTAFAVPPRVFAPVVDRTRVDTGSNSKITLGSIAPDCGGTETGSFDIP